MTDSVKETTEDVKEYIIARLKMPVFFYYLLALALWNWDILLMILKSRFDIEDVIWYIKNHYNGHQRLWLPLILAILSSIAFPLVMLGLDWLLKFVNIARIKSVKQVSVEEAYAQYDIQSARNKTNELKDLNDLIENRNRDVDILERKIDDLNMDLNKSNETYIKLSKALEDEKQETKDLLSSNSYMRSLLEEFRISPLVYIENFNSILNTYEKKLLFDLMTKLMKSNFKIKSLNVIYFELIERMIIDELLVKVNEQISITPKGILFYYYNYIAFEKI